VLLFSQRVAFRMLSQGHSRIGNLADNTTRFIEDHVAEFIISNGGWVSCWDSVCTCNVICCHVTVTNKSVSVFCKTLAYSMSMLVLNVRCAKMLHFEKCDICII